LRRSLGCSLVYRSRSRPHALLPAAERRTGRFASTACGLVEPTRYVALGNAHRIGAFGEPLASASTQRGRALPQARSIHGFAAHEPEETGTHECDRQRIASHLLFEIFKEQTTGRVLCV